MLAPVLACAGIFGNVRGIVHDPDHRPVAGAQVTLRAAHADWSQMASTTAGGEVEFGAVPAGEYRVTVSREGFAPVEERVTLAAGSAPVLHFQLTLAVARQAVEVAERADAINPESAASTTVIDRGEIEHAPGAGRTNSLAMITNFVPGAYMVHDQLHIRGGHQVSSRVDGVPGPNTSMAGSVGPQRAPQNIH